jgi:hypothetical protein
MDLAQYMAFERSWETAPGRLGAYQSDDREHGKV